MGDAVEIPLALGEIVVALRFIAFGSRDVADDARAVGLKGERDHIEHQPGVFGVTAPIACDAVARRANAEVGAIDLRLGPVDPFALDLDAVFEIADGREILIQSCLVVLAHASLKRGGLLLDEVEQAAALRERQFGIGQRVVIFRPKEFFKEHLGSVLRRDRGVIAAPRERHGKWPAKAGLAHGAEHERGESRSAAMEARDLLIQRSEHLSVAHRIHPGEQAAARSVTTAVGAQSRHHGAVVLEGRERLKRRRESVVAPGVRRREAANLQAEPPITEHRAAGNLTRGHGARGGDVLSLCAHGFEPRQGDASSQAFEKSTALQTPLVGLNVHRWFPENEFARYFAGP